ncbi:YgiQ family radical SAM protein [Alkalilimnicola sp. S0819]|uniref:YgiQ family radical SAM protein n=1 Tax=Alkalilimnicola sp. S0819 TaxID=2613922 RepID=UPI0012618644|nr:YgiQ family radical SAM protein [Alkalilimnicola sp. S0819]KAB7627671.1 YgiQ family radical SAM protein [Alkalilimnicola sp. S0819]MPQ15838.1 YgiQ family radical SAM protein [Alkalilimnicola sp. S0819]
MHVAQPLFSRPPYWAECFGTAPFLPMSRAEMDELGWDSCDIIIVCGDAYVDHPSFGMAVIGRLLERQGFRVGIIAQPDWSSAEAFQALGKPNLFFAVSAGNMDSMINRYTADRKVRHDDAYTPHNEGGKRPDRAVLVYTQRCREAYKDSQVLIGGIEASLRRIAHYDYWSDKVRRSVLLDSKADLLVYGNAERAVVDIAHRAACGEALKDMADIRGTARLINALPEGWKGRDSSRIDKPGKVDPLPNPYAYDAGEAGGDSPCAGQGKEAAPKPAETKVVRISPVIGSGRTYILLPAYEQVKSDPVLYAHTSRVLHLETNPANAHTLVQPHGDRYVWLTPPPLPLSTEELDSVFELPYQRVPHPAYGEARIPAYEMIRFSVNIMRGCFGGCSFCSITEHEGRVIQSRSEDSIVREVEKIRDMTPGFTGTISDLGGPTANMYQLNCKSEEIHASCRRLSCVYPSICKNLVTDQSPTTRLYRRTRKLPGIKRVLVASGLRYDLAVKDPEYVEELVSHHVGGYLKIAPEHTEDGPLTRMMKPGMGSYYEFKRMFERFSERAGKQQFLIPYFISAHPGTTDEDMLNLALWLRNNGFRADQVQNFYPSPMASATAMYHTGKDPLHRIDAKAPSDIPVPKGARQRRLHKAFLRYHDPDNWPLLRDALKRMGREDLIGYSKQHLVPPTQPANHPSAKREARQGRAQPRKGQVLTQHTGLPPRKGAGAPKRRGGRRQG